MEAGTRMDPLPKSLDSSNDFCENSFRSRKRQEILKQRLLSLQSDDRQPSGIQEEPVTPSPRMANAKERIRSSSLSRISSKKNNFAFSGSFLTKRRADVVRAGTEKPPTPPRPPAPISQSREATSSEVSKQEKRTPDRDTREKQKRRLGFGLRQFSSSPNKTTTAQVEMSTQNSSKLETSTSEHDRRVISESSLLSVPYKDPSVDSLHLFHAGSWEAKSDISFPSTNVLNESQINEEKKDSFAEERETHPNFQRHDETKTILEDLARRASLGPTQNSAPQLDNLQVAKAPPALQLKSLLPPPPPPGNKKKRGQGKKVTRQSSRTDGTIASIPEIDEDALSVSETSDEDGGAEEFSRVSDQVHSPPNFLHSRSTHSYDAIAPASSSTVINDQKMAEKVDRAISAAALVLEQRMVIENPALSSREDDSGAFAQWHSVEAETISGPAMSVQQNKQQPKNLHIFPDFHPSPFEAAVYLKPLVVRQILNFVGDPVTVCRVKMLNRNCREIVRKNEYKLMRDAVRLGGLKMSVRPYFWLWITVQKWAASDEPKTESQPQRFEHTHELTRLERMGREGKWHGVIDRDVTRSFGNLPPHKTGARLRTDSIVRALITWGQSRFLPRGIRGVADAPVHTSGSRDEEESAPREIVQNWSGVTPVGSFASDADDDRFPLGHATYQYKMLDRKSDEEMALSGNTLTDEAKDRLQHKLSFILHALAAAHRDVGYCQGMDYVVAHLLRILQDTIRWQASTGTLPSTITCAPEPIYGPNLSQLSLQEAYDQVDRTLVVEEVCFRVMDVFMSTYGLRHFYWPELRCLKTCCRVFEKLIQIKLPVLAEHFEYHELNVGLFALGWFQTLFLYLPSMPSATVCHIWDIWLVERSFKIFFRVATAILFLSQPILLNHELEGMMSYLNTFPDATLLSPDILIACALQIKVTNRMLMDLEEQVVAEM